MLLTATTIVRARGRIVQIGQLSERTNGEASMSMQTKLQKRERTGGNRWAKLVEGLISPAKKLLYSGMNRRIDRVRPSSCIPCLLLFHAYALGTRPVGSFANQPFLFIDQLFIERFHKFPLFLSNLFYSVLSVGRQFSFKFSIRDIF